MIWIIAAIGLTAGLAISFLAVCALILGGRMDIRWHDEWWEGVKV